MYCATGSSIALSLVIVNHVLPDKREPYQQMICETTTKMVVYKQQ